MITTKRALIVSAAGLLLGLAGCGGPAEGEPYEKPVGDQGTAQGRLKTDEGAEQGIGGGGARETATTPSAEPVPPGG